MPTNARMQFKFWRNHFWRADLKSDATARLSLVGVFDFGSLRRHVIIAGTSTGPSSFKGKGRAHYMAMKTGKLVLLIVLPWTGQAFVTAPMSSTVHDKNSPRRTSTSSSRRHASRSICTFDKSDFALPTGEWPYSENDFNRLDQNDEYFYIQPRFVTHIDERAIESLTDFYKDEFESLNKEKLDVLDLCSSWISHLPTDIQYGRVVGIGMNEEELAANKQLTEWSVQDLNETPMLSQYKDNSFDVVCNVVSVDYLIKPRELFQEMNRVLRPGGVALMSFSNRCFPTKAVAMWLQADDIGRMTIVASYFHYSAPWKSIEALDIKLPPMQVPERPSFGEMFKDPAAGFAWMNTAASVQKANAGDPMFVVKGIK